MKVFSNIFIKENRAPTKDYQAQVQVMKIMVEFLHLKRYALWVISINHVMSHFFASEPQTFEEAGLASVEKAMD